MEFLQDYTFVLKHKAGIENKVADASTEVIGFERLREEYDSCPDFGKIYVTLRDGPVREMYGFLLKDGYLFRFRKLCISRTSLRDFLS